VSSNPVSHRILAWLVSLLAVVSLPHVAAQQAPPKVQTDLDTFMARVLARRDENWRTLHDYILSETERFSIAGPGRVTLYGLRREYDWYVREGFLIRSPIRFDGVAIPEPERRRYEENWLKEERDREAKRTKPAAGNVAAAGGSGAGQRADAAPTLEGFVAQRGEPRFVSEAYFLKFKFEPGNYYLVGRERLDGRDVVRIEYYPRRLFADEEPAKEKEPQQPAPAGTRSKERERERAEEERIERSFNKVALITLWIDPVEYQIVRYTFDNVDFGFLPGRWLVRVDDIRASMTMARVFDGAWLPREMTMRAGLSFASGSYQFQYGREFYNHKKAEVSARIRSIGKQ
jgi:hypothetical protein